MERRKEKIVKNDIYPPRYFLGWFGINGEKFACPGAIFYPESKKKARVLCFDFERPLAGETEPEIDGVDFYDGVRLDEICYSIAAVVRGKYLVEHFVHPFGKAEARLAVDSRGAFRISRKKGNLFVLRDLADIFPNETEPDIFPVIQFAH